jgi:predicted HAD superfamily hydrolase
MQDDVLVASIDCFDTLLLREPKSEPVRFLEIAAEQLKSLNESGIDCNASVKDIRRIRIGASRAWTHDASVRKHTKLPMHRAILSTIASDLGLPGTAVDILRNAELSYELTVLRTNLQLVDVLRELMENGKKVILVSDMYLSGEDISWLVQNLWEDGRSLNTYSSADLGVTKQSGAMYGKVLRLEGINSDAIVHVGDNKYADVTMARRHGIRAFHTPRKWTHNATNFAYRVIDKLQKSGDAG